MPEHQALLCASTQSFTAQLFAEAAADADSAPPAPGRRGGATKGTKFNSVGSQFKKQLAELMVQLHAMEPHYIRCIKPNESAQVGAFGGGGAPMRVLVCRSLFSCLAQQLKMLVPTLPDVVTTQPSVFENKNVLHQLKCGGVMEAVRISCAGFPSKRPYGEFVDHFWQLAPDLLKTDADDKAITKAILAKTNVGGYQLGLSKVRTAPL